MPNQRVFPPKFSAILPFGEKLLQATEDFTPLPKESQKQYFNVIKLKVRRFSNQDCHLMLSHSKQTHFDRISDSLTQSNQYC